MKHKLLKLFGRIGYRYLIIGFGVYIFELLVIVLVKHLGHSTVTAVALSFWLGIALSFTLQKTVTFQDKRLHHKVLISQLLAYGGLVLFNFFFTVFVAKLLSDALPAVVIRTLTLAITTTWNFYLYKTKIFKSTESPVY